MVFMYTLLDTSKSEDGRQGLLESGVLEDSTCEAVQDLSNR
jgi:hypothetical protein